MLVFFVDAGFFREDDVFQIGHRNVGFLNQTPAVGFVGN